MRPALQKLQLLTKRIQREGTSEHVLCEVIVTLADEVIRLSRELEREKEPSVSKLTVYRREAKK